MANKQINKQEDNNTFCPFCEKKVPEIEWFPLVFHQQDAIFVVVVVVVAL